MLFGKRHPIDYICKTFISIPLRIRIHLTFTLALLWAFSLAQADSLLVVYRSSDDPAERVRAGIKLAMALKADHPDSGLIILQRSAAIALQEELFIDYVESCMASSELCFSLDDYTCAFDFLQKGRRILEEKSSVKKDSTYYMLLSKIALNQGLVLIRNNMLDEGLEYFIEADKLISEAAKYTTEDIITENLIKLNVNVAAVYIYKGDYETAEVHLTKALNLYKGGDNFAYTHILNNIAIAAKETGNISKAIDFNQRALAIREQDNDSAGIAQSLNNLGSCYFLLGDREKAMELFKRSLSVSSGSGQSTSAIIALTYLSDLLYNTGNYKQAYERHTELKRLNDSLNDISRFKLLAQMETKERYDRQIRKIEIEQEKQASQRQRRELLFTLGISLSLLALVILILVYFLQRNKIKRVTLETEKDRLTHRSLELEKENLEKTLEFRDKELATNVMYMARTNEFIMNIAEKLLQLKLTFSKEKQSSLNQVINELQRHVDQDSWKEFEVRFQQVHNDFYTKLNVAYPNLTSNEKKLCAFLRLNMTTKEISAITYQSVNSILVARSRLRKKMGLDTDENLISFLESL